MSNETGIGNWSATVHGHAFPQHFFAQFADGREERVTGVTVKDGETIAEAMERARIEIGAVAIVLKPPKDGAA